MFSVAQTESQKDSVQVYMLESESDVLKKEGWMLLSMGVFSKSLAFSAFVNYPNFDANDIGMMSMNGAIGITLDSIAISKFVKSRRKQKEADAIRYGL